MKKYILIFSGAIILSLSFLFLLRGDNDETIKNMEKEIYLPQVQKESNVSVEEALEKRRSIRDFKDEELSLKQVSQILWSSQGITGEMGKRTSPSAGATYPLEVYIVVRKVEKLNPGIYHYFPEEHKLKLISSGEFWNDLMRFSLNQSPVSEAPINIVFSAVYERTTNRYGERGERYVHMEAGHAAQNIYLQAESLNLGTVLIGAFNDREVKELLNIEEEPLYIIPIGKK